MLPTVRLTLAAIVPGTCMPLDGIYESLDRRDGDAAYNPDIFLFKTAPAVRLQKKGAYHEYKLPTNCPSLFHHWRSDGCCRTGCDARYLGTE
jgi:hypothetical protein